MEFFLIGTTLVLVLLLLLLLACCIEAAGQQLGNRCEQCADQTKEMGYRIYYTTDSLVRGLVAAGSAGEVYRAIEILLEMLGNFH